MSWTTATDDLRTQLSDGAEDKFRYRKQVFGKVDGVNTLFKTFEFRRVTDFTAPTDRLGVYVNGVQQSGAALAADILETGEFEFVTAPTNGQRVEATYYLQWFTDAELDTFLRLSCNWLAKGDDYSQIEQGLRPAAIAYAQGIAYEKLALRWSEKLSETYLLQDQIDKDRFALAEMYQKWGADFKKQADKIRRDFYSRAGQQEQPSWGSIFGGVADPVPKR
jgi:hypothetical protein